LEQLRVVIVCSWERRIPAKRWHPCRARRLVPDARVESETHAHFTERLVCDDACSAAHTSPTLVTRRTPSPATGPCDFATWSKPAGVVDNLGRLQHPAEISSPLGMAEQKLLLGSALSGHRVQKRPFTLAVLASL